MKKVILPIPAEPTINVEDVDAFRSLVCLFHSDAVGFLRLGKRKYTPLHGDKIDRPWAFRCENLGNRGDKAICSGTTSTETIKIALAKGYEVLQFDSHREMAENFVSRK